MASHDTRELLVALEDYHSALQKHLIELRTEYDQMENRWHAFSYVYAGDAAEQFHASWARTVDRFREYQNRTDGIARILEERIAALRRANQTESELS